MNNINIVELPDLFVKTIMNRTPVSKKGKVFLTKGEMLDRSRDMAMLGELELLEIVVEHYRTTKEINLDEAIEYLQDELEYKPIPFNDKILKMDLSLFKRLIRSFYVKGMKKAGKLLMESIMQSSDMEEVIGDAMIRMTHLFNNQMGSSVHKCRHVSIDEYLK